MSFLETVDDGIKRLKKERLQAEARLRGVKKFEDPTDAKAEVKEIEEMIARLERYKQDHA